MTWEPLALGLAASALAAVRIAGWLALGSCAVTARGSPALEIPLSLLVGSALTAASHAVLASLGHVTTGLVLDVLACSVALAFYRRRVWDMVRLLATVPRRYLIGPGGALALMPLGLLLWIAAIAPPRDADVTRYHLAHIRQISMEGAWVPIPDCHSAMPFGWSLNYLPFERLGLPQAAHLVNLLVWLIASSLMLYALRDFAMPEDTLLLCAFVTLQPQVFKALTTAHADAYMMFVVAAVALLVLRFPEAAPREYAMLGFSAWIGAQSRYQAIGVGLSATLLVIWWAVRREAPWGSLRAFALGAGAALALSAPFYVVNAIAYGSPTWPLLTTIFGRDTHTDMIAAACFPTGLGVIDPRLWVRGLWKLLSMPHTFPIPLLILAFIPAALGQRSGPQRKLAVFALTFIVLWFLLQPIPYARFSLFLVPVVVLGWPPLLAGWTISVARRTLVRWALIAGGLGLLALDTILAGNAIAFARTGDQDRYHEFTPYYPVYEWANRSTDPHARFLVIVTGGQTYYLDRRYRGADPRWSAVVDWSSLRGPEDFQHLLSIEGYDYVIYEDRGWSETRPGDRMSRLIHGSIERGLLVVAARFEVRLYAWGKNLRRVWYGSTTVFVLARPPAHRSTGTPLSPVPSWSASLSTATASPSGLAREGDRAGVDTRIPMRSAPAPRATSSASTTLP